MGRSEGYWWSPDSKFLAYQQTDESAVQIRHIADPLHPEAAPTTSPIPPPAPPTPPCASA